MRPVEKALVLRIRSACCVQFRWLMKTLKIRVLGAYRVPNGVRGEGENFVSFLLSSRSLTTRNLFQVALMLGTVDFTCIVEHQHEMTIP